MEHVAWVVALTGMISAVFHHGGDVSFVAEKLKGILDPPDGQWSDGRYVSSLVAAIGGIPGRHMIAIGLLAAHGILPHAYRAEVGAAPVSSIGMLCPSCSQPRIVRRVAA